MKDHVTKLHEYGLAFLGPYCAVVGRSLESGSKEVHGDQERRKLLYTYYVHGVADSGFEHKAKTANGVSGAM